MERLRPCEPEIIEAATDWLAVTPKDYPYRIGVVGKTEDEARRRFIAAVAAWDDLIARADAEGVA